MSEMTSWPSGIRDTTEFPAIDIPIEVSFREHMEAFINMNGVGWNDYETQEKVCELDVSASRLRTFRKLYERMGMIYKSEGVIKLSRLGKQIAELERNLYTQKETVLKGIRLTAVDILKRYQLKNPIDGAGVPDDCDVLPCVCIWRAMFELGGKINYEEMNRVILHVVHMKDLPAAISKIKAARSQYGDYSGKTNEELDSILGTQVHTDQPTARIAPWFSFAGWGGLLIEKGVDAEGYRVLCQAATPVIKDAIDNPPMFYAANDEEDWLRYYIGSAVDSDSPASVRIRQEHVDEELTLKELGERLSEMYNTAGTGLQVAAIHMFGIKYGYAILAGKFKPIEIIRTAGINDSYQTELNKALNIYKCLKADTFGITFEQKKSPVTAVGSASRCYGGSNILFYGVPGAGKSHAIKKIVKDSVWIERAVFHPDYSYSDFVGQILPVVEKDATGADKLRYKFVPGPFTRMLKKAYEHPECMCYLVIEEINRGNAPAIFGEVFQLLDRDGTGASEYGISNEEIAGEVYGDKTFTVKIPSNLSLLATMNTSDQNVFTLDTAFQRRWEMKQIANDVLAAVHANELIQGTSITWGAFAATVNDAVVDANSDMVSFEDKRLGAYFVKKEELVAGKFPEKALKYLWDDAFKMNRDYIFNAELKTFEQVVAAYSRGSEDKLKAVLRAEIYQKMLLSMTVKEATTEV